MFFSASTGGFYDPAIHRTLPDDAVRISNARYVELIEARSAGKRVIADPAGRPVIKAAKLNLEQLRNGAIASVKREASRRILAVASLERQANDNADIALAALAGATADFNGALDRRARINAIRAASNAIEKQIGRMPATNLCSFDPTTHSLWPEKS